MRKFGGVLAGLVPASLVLAGAALAGSGASANGYGGKAGNVQQVLSSKGSLPFTGLDLAVIVVFALALVAAGFFVRRLGRNDA